MKSGGEFKINLREVKDLNKDGKISDKEIKSALRDEFDAHVKNINEGDIVVVDDDRSNPLTWGEIKTKYNGAVVQRGQTLVPPSPQDALQQNSHIHAAEAAKLSREIELLNAAQNKGDQTLLLPGTAASIPLTSFQSEIASREQRLRQLIMQMEYASFSNPSVARAEINRKWYSQAGLREPSSGNGSGGGTFQARAMTAAPGGQVPGGGNGGAPGAGQQARGMGMPGGGIYGGGNPMFGGMQPPTSAAYAMAMYNDSIISEGLGSVLRSSSEGRKLMMLFFYYARMAESGDLGAMYQFMKFLTHVIAKDKARQNIKMGTKLIQLQDMDRKATEALMSAPSDDPNKMNEFTKILQQTQSEQRMISMSQKLIADMSQEFAHVQEALISLTKALQESWARALRTSTSR